MVSIMPRWNSFVAVLQRPGSALASGLRKRSLSAHSESVSFGCGFSAVHHFALIDNAARVTDAGCVKDCLLRKFRESVVDAVISNILHLCCRLKPNHTNCKFGRQ